MSERPEYDIVAPRSVFRALADLSEDDYDLVTETVLALAVDPFSSQVTKLRLPNTRITLADGSVLSGPFFRVRCRSATGGQSGGFRIVYVVDSRGKRVCLVRIARREDDTYKALERVLRGARLGPFR